MISPLAYTRTTFEPINQPQEIYEIDLPQLNYHVNHLEVSAFKYKKVANRIKPVATTLPEKFRIVH
jgi:hypothetical protein